MAPVRGALHAVARAAIPSAADLDAEGWTRLDAIVDEAVASRPRTVQRQIVLFMRVLGVFSWIRFARPLRRLDATRTRRLIGFAERSRALALRRGIWGVRTLVFMGYYGQSSVQRAIGYRASAGRWEERRSSDA